MSDAPGAVVLAGGGSTRMGTSKAELDWHGMPLLARVVGIAARDAAAVVVVGGPPVELPAGVIRAADRAPGRGPLEGIAVGLRALADVALAAVVTSTDAPFLHPTFLRGVAAALARHQVAVPVADGREHPLAACWSLSALDTIDEALIAGRLRVRSLLDRLDVIRLDAAGLEHPESLRNLNTPEDYRMALAERQPLVTVVGPDGRRTPTRAATLAAVELNGRPAGPGPVPMVEGDVVRLAATG